MKHAEFIAQYIADFFSMEAEYIKLVIISLEIFTCIMLLKVIIKKMCANISMSRKEKVFL